MDVCATQYGDHESRAGYIERHPGQHALRSRVENLQLGKQETDRDDDADDGESGQDALHLIAPSAALMVLYACCTGYATNANRRLSGDQLLTLMVPCPPNSWKRHTQSRQSAVRTNRTSTSRSGGCPSVPGGKLM
jgi:hypothetical protein